MAAGHLGGAYIAPLAMCASRDEQPPDHLICGHPIRDRSAMSEIIDSKAHSGFVPWVS